MAKPKKNSKAKKKAAKKAAKKAKTKAPKKPSKPKAKAAKKPTKTSSAAKAGAKIKSSRRPSRPVRKKGPKKKMKPVRLVRAGEVEASPRKRKVKALAKGQWGSFERELLELRDSIINTVESTQKSSAPVTGQGDEADIASQNIEREIQFEMSENERKMLDQINAALRRIEKGTYGICEACREPIDINRIKALPFVRYCIGCQGQHESAVLIL